VRARWLCLLATLALVPAFAGCGGISNSPASQNVGEQLTIYSSLPLQGPSAAISKQIVGGEKLALSNANGHVGELTVSYVSLDDSNPTTGAWDPGVTATNAKSAAQDPTTIAYIGELNSGATAVSLPLINAAGILQVSPSSPYVGLTSSLDAGQDEPERFYPTAKRNFGRVAPGDPVQGEAQVDLMGKLKVKRVYVISDQDPFDMPLAEIVAGDAQRAGLEVRGEDTVAIVPGANFTGEVAKIARSGAQAVFVSATATTEAAFLVRQLHNADPHLWVLASNTMQNSLFTSRLRDAESSTLIGTPALALASYPAPAQRVLGQYRRRFAAAPGPYVLYGYEAMQVVLDAIRSGGAHGNDRQTVIQKFFATSRRGSTLGPYSIRSSGETTLSRYGIDKVVHGAPVPWQAIPTAATR
jgi:branched-chain amino acid transport system substrate-binding protein